jgi:ATP-dependent Lhr-like helicase
LRWGVVFRDIVQRETIAPPWRDILVALRRLELQGVVRGGRFVSSYVGEQFCRPDALEALRSVRLTESTYDVANATRLPMAAVKNIAFPPRKK